MILLIDNYDSFTFNLQRYLVRLGQKVQVIRNDAPELDQDLTRDYSAVVISPGPKRPADAGNCLELVSQYSGRLPILGVCLGHQVIFEAFGGTVGRAKRPAHGKACLVELHPSRLFAGIENRSSFARYHSLVGLADSLPAWLRVIAWSDEREIMGVEHIEHPTFGVQFHPESVLSPNGYRVLHNFLICAGVPTVEDLPEADLRASGNAVPLVEAADDHVQPIAPVALPMPVK